MSSANIKREAVIKAEADSEVEVKVEQAVYCIDSDIEEKPNLATVRPLKLEIDDLAQVAAEPQPSTSRAVAEVRVGLPPPAPIKYEDPFALAPRASRSPPAPPADRAKRRSVPGGHESARPRLKHWPYQHRR